MNCETHLKTLITSQGAMDLSQFMQEALLHPQYGYYQTKQVFGSAGDFITAPEISQIFGELVGVWCGANWLTHYKNESIALVELGPGRGTLMRDALRGTQHIPEFHQHTEIHLIEASQSLQETQKATLSEYDLPMTWHDTLDHLPCKPTLFIANEFFDALPIHQYQHQKQQWFETKLNILNNQLAFHLEPAAISASLKEQYPDCPDGGYVEISPASHQAIQHISKHIEQYGGAAIIIDYGYDKNLYQNTFQAVKEHQFHSPLEDIGHADLTTHVDFCTLSTLAQKQHVNVSPIITQKEFLEKMGIHLRLESLLQHASPKQQETLKQSVQRLTSEDAMGTLFKVLMLTHHTTTNPLEAS